MSTMQQNSSAVTGNYWSGTSTKNNNGTAVNIGTSSVLNNQTLTKNGDITGNLVIDGTDTNKAVSGGPIQNNTVKPIAIRLTTSLATVQNTYLLSGSTVPSELRSINYTESTITDKTATATRAGYFNIYRGKFINPANGQNYVVPTGTDSFGNDSAARATRLVPGTLRYSLGQNVIGANYKAKTA